MSLLCPQRLTELFDSSISNDFLRDTLHCLFAAYQEAWLYCQSSFPPSEAHDLYPVERRARFERSWREVALLHGLDAQAIVNKSRNAWHTEVRSGAVVLTAAAAPTPNTIIRRAEYRRTLARSNQGYLFGPPFGPKEPEPGDRLYGIVLHGPDGVFRNRPGFVEVVFPDPSLTTYVGRVNLLARYPETASQIEVPVERIPEDLSLRLRGSVARRREQA